MSALTLLAGANSLDGSRDPLLGIVAVRLKCRAESLLDAITQPPPSIGLALVENQPRTFSRDVSGDQGGYIVEITLEGVTNPESAEGDEYALDGSSGTEPIDTSNRLLTLREVYKYDKSATKKEGRTVWPPEIADENGGTKPNPMAGVDVYHAPSLIWSHRWVSRTLPQRIVGNLGFIDNPPGNPPELSGNRNWLKIRARATWRGNIWQIEESWELSEEGGWVPELYNRLG